MSLPPRQNVPPLDIRTPIVDPSSGAPTSQFIRLWQNLFGNSRVADKDAADSRNQFAQELASKVDKTVSVIAGVALSGGGVLTGDVTLDLENTGVTPGVYENPTLAVDAQGRITTITSNISGSGARLYVQPTRPSIDPGPWVWYEVDAAGVVVGTEVFYPTDS